MQFQRYAVYYTLPDGPLAQFCTAWLGWDLVKGQTVAHPDLPRVSMPVADITATPRKYGLHATIKPPFRLAQGRSETGLAEALVDLTTHALRPVTGLRLSLTPLGRFLALTASGNMAPLNNLAAITVEALDPFRAPATQADLDRRRASGLTSAQEAMLRKWGYPYVMDEFRFHITLSGKLPKPMLPAVQAALNDALTGLIPDPFQIDSLSLVGEAEDGRFHLLHRQTLSA